MKLTRRNTKSRGNRRLPALIKAREGDTVWLNTPDGREQIEILVVEYIKID